MEKAIFKFTVTPEISVYGPEFDAQIDGAISVWSEVPSMLNDLKIQIGSETVLYQADWESISKKMIYDLNIERKILDASKNSKEKRMEFFKELESQKEPDAIRKINKNVEVEITSLETDRNEYFSSIYLAFVFIVLNIASPGSLSLYQEKKESEQLHCGILDCAWSESLKNSFPIIKKIELDKVIKWINKNYIFSGDYAQSKIQRAIYSIINICLLDINPMVTIWIAHSLETLLDSPSASISSSIMDRIFLVLDEVKNNKKKFRKLFREFYKLRSKIAHGDYTTPLPLQFCEDIPSKVLEQSYEPDHFALSIIIAILQKMIANNWSEIKFKEEFFAL